MEEQGGQAVFAVSDEESLRIVEHVGCEGIVLGGSKMDLGACDADLLAAEVGLRGASAVLVDTYAAGEDFFRRLRHRVDSLLAYIDDLFLFSKGFLPAPLAFPVDVVVNYGFGFSDDDYRTPYAASGARILAGPGFAPVSGRFGLPRERCAGDDVRILVTSGSTNPDGVLERMAQACVMGAPGAVIDLVVGQSASVTLPDRLLSYCRVHRGVADLAPLMREADFAVSAAGFTLYELSCMGVPTVAVPIVDNQMGNVAGFARRGLGLTFSEVMPTAGEIAVAVQKMFGNKGLREELGSRARQVVDGRGSARIARALAQG
ncbi:MAG: hypothetical protein HFJ75_07310 [Eggerthellaceae bacterium]|nr:hypothetical protein [Eggerthellaceae bacterium]